MKLHVLITASAVAVVGVAIGVAAPAAAECTYANGATVCAQGDVRGPSGDISGPVVPYPCEYDWLCYDGDVDIVFGSNEPPQVNPSPPIDIGRPGRPGRN